MFCCLGCGCLFLDLLDLLLLRLFGFGWLTVWLVFALVVLLFWVFDFGCIVFVWCVVLVGCFVIGLLFDCLFGWVDVIWIGLVVGGWFVWALCLCVCGYAFVC